MIIVNDLNSWLNETLAPLACSREAVAYIVDVLANKHIVQKGSIVLAFAEAKTTGKFVSYQEIGDWSLFLHSTFKPTHDDVQVTLARLSYYACYRMLRKEWKLYEELADQFPAYTEQIRHTLHRVQ